jgi:hypothetical protein
MFAINGHSRNVKKNNSARQSEQSEVNKEQGLLLMDFKNILMTMQ